MGMQQRVQASYSRFDAETAGVVEKGIALQFKVGTGYAATFLKSKEIALPVILRVLLRAEQRRGHFNAVHS
jgi:hypothetical protein